MEQGETDDVKQLVQVERLLEHIQWFLRLRRFFWFLLFTLLYTLYNAIDIDFQYAHNTHSMFKLSLDKIPGVSAGEEPELCFDGQVDGEPCWEPYLSMSTEDDLVRFLYDRVANMGFYLNAVCPQCALGITTEIKDVDALDIHEDFICSDFEKHKNEYIDRDCKTVDAEWAANPSAASAPCCDNQTLIKSSVAMIAIQALRGDDTRIKSLQDAKYYKQDNREQVRNFISEQVQKNSKFLQIIISRDSRMFGMVYYAYLENEKWSPGQIDPSIEYWSGRYDMHGVLKALKYIGMVLNLIVLCLDVQEKIAISITWKDCARKFLVFHFICLTLPSSILPLCQIALESVLPKASSITFVSMIELVVLARFLYEGKAFFGQQLLMTLTLALKPISELMMVLLPVFLMIACIECQLYGVYSFADATTAGVYFTALTDLFSEFANGVEKEEAALDANPFAATALNLILTVVLFLTLSQVFITLLMDSFERAEELRQEERDARALPEGYINNIQQVPSRLSKVQNALCMLGCGWLPLYKTWCFSFLKGLQIAIQQTEAADIPVMMSPEQLQLALAQANPEWPVKPHLVVQEVYKYFGACTERKSTPSNEPLKRGLTDLRAAIDALAEELELHSEVSDFDMFELSKASSDLAQVVHSALAKHMKVQSYQI